MTGVEELAAPSRADGDRGTAPDSTSAEWLAYWTFRSTEWVSLRLPRPIGVALGEQYFHQLFRLAEGQRRTVAGNLARVLGHPPDSPLVQIATRECFRLYGRYWYETFALRSMSVAEVNARFKITGMEHLAKGIHDGTGAVMVLPHMGNWDAAGHWLALQGYRMTAVAEELKPRRVFELFYRHRRALGMNIVPLTGPTVAERLMQVIRENQVLTLVADRDLTGRGVEVEMFGAPRRLPAGPARLALSTGAPLSVCAVFTTDQGWHCVINPPVVLESPSGHPRTDVGAMTREIARQFEGFIAASPPDWHMFQPAWGEDSAGTSARGGVAAAAAASG
jgi:phosphatidylinositol dimannoside acyltransferase